MKVTSEVNDILIKAYETAKEKNSEYITPEHLLYAATFDENIKGAIKSCGGIIDNLRYNLLTYIRTYINKKNGEPQESIEFQRVILRANEQVVFSQREAIDVEHIIAAIYELEESYAHYYLSQEGVEERDILYYLCHKEDMKSQYVSDEADESHLLFDKQEENDEKESKIKKENAFLDKFVADLTSKVTEQGYEPLIGREDILNRTIQVLCRKNKNNPVHIGESGVGKTAITEGLARMIAEGNVPDKLKESRVYSLDIGSVIAGTKYRGDFEERIKRILNLISKKKDPIVYIDEIHNIVGAGALNGGALDASNLLKPYLTDGRIKFIGATTYDEYKKYFEKDKALARRFQTIDVKQPTIEEAIKILYGLKESYENFHNVEYTEEAIKSAVILGDKFINDRYLPDKAIDIIDEAGAYVRNKIDVDKHKIVVDENIIETVISKMCNIPRQSVESNEVDNLKHLEEKLKNNVFNQDKAVDEIVRCIKMSRAGLNDEQKPVASMLFVGPTGVGKTEIARKLSEILSIELIRFDMSEYSEKHSAAKLIGSPPGYVGYEEGGLLIDSIKKTPHCVLLLDEIEKAHEDIINVLLQVMDYATLTDNKGRKADFRNVIVIMTSNAGAKNIGKKLIGFGEREIQGEAILEEVKRYFTPEFRNRLDKIVVFNHINDKMANDIAKKHLKEFKDKLKKRNIDIEYDEDVIKQVASQGTSHEFGAREVKRIIESKIKPLFMDEILFGLLKEGGKCKISYENDSFTLIC